MTHAHAFASSHQSRPGFQFGPLLVALGIAVGLLGCDGSSVTGPSPSDDAKAPVSVSFSSASGSASKAGQAQRTFTDSNGNTLRLDQVEIVLRDVEIERADGTENCSSEDGSGSEEDCEGLKSGPLLVPLPLNASGPTVVIDTTLPIGKWEEMEFNVHKFDPDLPSDSTFLQENNFPPNVSIRAEGAYTPAGGTAQDFTYTSDLDAEREIKFEPPIQVTADETKNITFSVALTTWFRQQDSTLVNPTQAGDDGPLEELVESNIKASIEGFEDDDQDGNENGENEGNDDNGNEDDDDDEGDDDGDDNGDDDGNDDDGDDENGDGEINEVEIEKPLNNTGPDADASGEAEFEQESDATTFKVEVESLDPGTYDVVVADTTRGQIDVAGGDEGTEGEIEFYDPAKSGHPLLDFDPRGKSVAVAQGGTVYLEVDFPSDDGNGEDDSNDGDDDD